MACSGSPVAWKAARYVAASWPMSALGGASARCQGSTTSRPPQQQPDILRQVQNACLLIHACAGSSVPMVPGRSQAVWHVSKPPARRARCVIPRASAQAGCTCRSAGSASAGRTVEHLLKVRDVPLGVCTPHTVSTSTCLRQQAHTVLNPDPQRPLPHAGPCQAMHACSASTRHRGPAHAVQPRGRTHAVAVEASSHLVCACT